MRRFFVALLLATACGDDGGQSGPDAGGTPPDGGTPDAEAMVIEPGDPGPSDVHIAVDTTAGRVPISPLIYGSNTWLAGRGLRMARLGGNRWTAYNWETNASNAGTDWYNQNDGFLSESDTPGDAVRGRVDEARGEGASVLLTIPSVGYVAADKAPGGDVNMTPDYLNVRFHDSYARKGAAFANPPDATDDAVYQDEFVAWVEDTWPGATAASDARIVFSIDNEPDLWSETHPRIHPDPVRYDELVARTREYASAIKDAAPQALVFGPVSYGWHGYTTLQDAPDGAGRDFVEFYLAELATAEDEQGTRLLDVLDLHWYPEAQGGGQRIVVDDASPAVAAARVQAPRSLWDDTYVEDSWIAEFSTQGPIRLIPRMQEKIAAHYPGTRLAFTEYYYGGGADVSGAIAQADVLGIFASEGVYAATLWQLGSTDQSFVYAAFDMYLDYDGAGGSAGDTSVLAASSDPSIASGHASIGVPGAARLVLVLVNRDETARTAGITVRDTVSLDAADVYQLTSASAAPVPAAGLTATAQNAFLYPMPARSVTTLVLR